jgi:UDP-2,4-diacetamido-2,4,6-trideoxy-beta-L-altropyranose hydrolase
MGSGHLMRCLTLGNRLREDGAAVSFISRELPGNMGEFVAAQGFPVHQLPAPGEVSESSNSPSPHAHWLGVDWRIDADETATILANEYGTLDWLVVDHYALDHEWETRLRPSARKIMVIDDLADRGHDCDLLLDQNLYVDYQSYYAGLVPASCQKLLGPHYALLRPEFLAARKTLRVRDGRIRRILIFFGGGDPTNETAKALEAVARLNRPEIAVDVVVGAANPHKRQIQTLIGALPKAAYHCQIMNMAELMAEADLAIGGGGTTTWERCCLGVPSIVVTIAANQVQPSKTMAATGRHLYLGNSDQVLVEGISSHLQALLHNHEWLAFLSRASSEIVDGLGVERVVAQLMRQGELILRRAEKSDAENIFSWRNADINRRYSLDSTHIPLAQHLTWFENTLKNPNNILLVGESNGEEIGILRYDLDGDSAKVSIYLVPGKHGRGYGTRLLRSGRNWIRDRYPNISTILAEVLLENQVSLRAFNKAGFRQYMSVFRDVLRP